MAKVIKTFFISTGRKNAMYTLKSRNSVVGEGATVFPEPHYICNLSADEEKAIEKARDYVEAFRSRVGETKSFSIVFDDVPETENTKRRGKLSVRDTVFLEQIEKGIFPFGKYEGKEIESCPESYILFWADLLTNSKEPLSFLKENLSYACLGIALKNGYIETRNAKKEEQRKQDLKSSFVGEKGKRLEFSGEIIYSFKKEQTFQDAYGYKIKEFFINKIRCGDNLICYIGKKLGEKGESISFKGTVKEHTEHEGIKTTVINRPAMI